MWLFTRHLEIESNPPPNQYHLYSTSFMYTSTELDKILSSIIYIHLTYYISYFERQCLTSRVTWSFNDWRDHSDVFSSHVPSGQLSGVESGIFRFSYVPSGQLSGGVESDIPDIWDIWISGIFRNVGSGIFRLLLNKLYINNS